MKKLRTKQGIASFYMVAIATLLLSVFTVGFTTYVVNEINRTTNFDLSQSAYDSALAGIEDAKLAIMNYRSCLKKENITQSEPNGDGTVTCDEIVWYMNHPDCYMVGHILGRIPEKTNTEVLIKEDEIKGNNMQQAYTCVKITNPTDYRTTLNSTASTKVIPIKIKNGNISDVKSIRLSWSDNSGVNYNNTITGASGYVQFPSLSSSSASNPPALMVQLVQTAPQFRLSDFTVSINNAETNRGIIVLTPSNGKTGRDANTVTDTNIDVTQNNTIGSNAFIKSNDKTVKNLPYLVNCPKDSDDAFLCSVSIEIPNPVGGNGRSEETFTLIVSLPYSGPNTDIAISVCSTSGSCQAQSNDENITTGAEEASTVFTLDNQVRIDSTGRANNLFRRIESRVESNNNPFESNPKDAMIALGSSNENTIIKEIKSNTEQNLFNAPAVYSGLNTYTLSFNAGNCGTGAVGIPAAQSSRANASEVFYIPNAEPKCANKNFIGWGLSSSATTNLYRPGSAFRMRGSEGYSKTLYAIWESQKFTVTYHPFGSTSEVISSRLENYGATITVLSSTATPSLFNGYELYGWARNVNSDTADYVISDNSSNKITVTQNIDLYAVWRKVKTFKFYQLNGQKTEVQASFFNLNQIANITVPDITAITLNGQSTTTRGWSTSNVNYAAAPMTPGRSFMVHPTDTETYYAAAYYTAQATYKIEGHDWTPVDEINRVSYTYVLSKGAAAAGATTYNVSTGKIRLPYAPKELVRGYVTGYELDQWAAGSASGTRYNPNTEVNLGSNITFYAKLKPSTFTVTFKSFDGGKTYGTQDFLYGTATTIRGAASAGWQYQKPNDDKPNSDNEKVFWGWSTGTNSTGISYNNSHSITTQFNRDGIVLYAVWYKKLTATFYNDGDAISRQVTIYNNQTSGTITTPNLPAKTGLTSHAWSSNSGNVATIIDKNAHNRVINKNESWYAAYSKTVKITYDKNNSSATGTTANTSGTAYEVYRASGTKTQIKAQISVANSGFTLEGRAFSNWKIGGTSYSPGATYASNDDVIAYANWTRNVYSITLDKNIGSATSTVTNPTSTIYVVYGSQYTTDSAGNSPISATNKITVPGKKFVITLHYNNGTTATQDVAVPFNGYYYGSTKVINSDGNIASSSVSKTFFNDSTAAANRKFIANWSSGSYTFSPESITNFTCKWRAGSTSGGEVTGATTISANTHYYSVCTQNNYTVTFNVSSVGYVSKSSSAGGAAFTGTVSVRAGSEVRIAGNELYFTDNSSVKYYAHAHIPSGYTFDGWTNISNGNTITANKTIGANWVARPYTCKSGETKIEDSTYGASSGGVVCTKAKGRYVYTPNSGIGCDYEYWDRGLGNYSGAITNGTSVFDYSNECVGCESGYTIEGDDYYSYASGNQCTNPSGCSAYIWGWWMDFEYGDWMKATVNHYVCKRTATCVDSWGAYQCTQYGKINSSHYSMACEWAYSDYPNSTSANTACYRAADPPTD